MQVGEPLDARTVLDRIGIAVAVLSVELRLEWANDTFLRWFPDGETGKAICETRGPWSGPRVERLLEATAGDAVEFEHLEVWKDERAMAQQQLLLTARSLPRSGGGAGVLLLIEEPTPSSLDHGAQQRRHLHALQELAADLAHEFNNVLVGVLGYASIAERDLEPDSSAFASVVRIQVAARRAVDLTNRLLMFSGRAGRETWDFDLAELAQGVTQRLRRALPQHISLEVQLEGTPLEVRGDGALVLQILDGILDNAVESIGDQQGVIRIHTGVVWADRAALARAPLADDLPEGEYALVEISDSGPGMDAETMQRATEPFFSTRFPGRGLGLAAAAGGIRALGGALLISSPEGEGATVELLLPRSSGQAERRPSEPDPVPGARARLEPGSTVLVIDHDETVLGLARDALESRGIGVVATRSPAEGVALFRGQPARFDALLLDVTMPESSGEEVLGQVRRIRADVAVVLSSGFGGARPGWPEPASASFLKKPYTTDELIGSLSEAISRVSRAAGS